MLTSRSKTRMGICILIAGISFCTGLTHAASDCGISNAFLINNANPSFHFSTIPNHEAGTDIAVTISVKSEAGQTITNFNARAYLYDSQGGKLDRSYVDIRNGTWSGDIVFALHVRSIRAESGNINGESNLFTVTSATSGNGTIKGTCVDSKGDRITSDTITVNLTGNNGTNRTLLTQTGRFTFGNLPEGYYSIDANGNIYKSEMCYTAEVEADGIATVRATLYKPGKAVILVPGLLGSTTDGGKAYPFHPTINGPLNDKITNLKLVKVAGLNVTVNVTELIARVGWNKLASDLNEKGYEVYSACWDWRRAINDEIVEEYLLPVIQKAKDSSHADKVDIIAHSAGGLLVRYYIQSSYYNNDIDKFAMVGTPNGGASILYYINEGWVEYSDDIKKDIKTYHNVIANLYSYRKNDKIDNLYKQPEGEIYGFIQHEIPAARDYMLISSPFIEKADGTKEWYYAKDNLLTSNLANQATKDRLIPGKNTPSDNSQVRTRMFLKSEPKSTPSSIPVSDDRNHPFNSSYGVGNMFPQGVPSGRSPGKASGDGTVLTVSAMFDLDPIDNYDAVVIYNGNDHASLPAEFRDEIVDFLEEGRVGLSSLFSVKSDQQLADALDSEQDVLSEITFHISGQVQPILTTPGSHRLGVDPNTGSYLEQIEAEIEIHPTYSSITIPSPEEGTYLLEFTGEAGEAINVGALYMQDENGISAQNTLVVGDGIHSIAITMSNSIEPTLEIHEPATMITNLNSLSEGGLTKLQWNEPQDDSVVGYRVYGRRQEYRLYELLSETTSSEYLTEHPWYQDESSQLWSYVVVSATSDGKESFLNSSVSNNKLLVAQLEADLVSGEAPLAVTFTDNSTGNPTTWEWDFDADGVVDSTDQNPTWTYTERGVNTVILVVTSDEGSDTTMRIGYIDVSKNILSDGVDIDDLFYMADAWLSSDESADVAPPGGDGIVNMLDFALLAEFWFQIPEGEVSVDGDISEWSDDVLWQQLDETYWGDSSDIVDAVFALSWNEAENKIYVAVKVTDTERVFSDTYVNWQASDRLEIYSQGSAAGGTGWIGTYDIAQQYYIAPNNTSGGSWATFAYGESLASDVGLEYAVQVSGDVIIYEIGVTLFENYGFFNETPTVVKDLSISDVIGFDVVALTQHAGGVGMKSENLMTGKSNNADKFRRYILVE